MKLTDRVNRWIHPVMLKYLRLQYRRKLAVCRRAHPEVFKPAGAECKGRHIALWGKLIKAVNCDWLDMFYGTSGKEDERFVPEDVWYGIIERCLNNCEASGSFVEDKNDVCFYIPKEYQPKCIVRYDRGMWFDGDFTPIAKVGAQELVKNYDGAVMVGKPSMGSSGGSNVRLWQREEMDLDYIGKNFEGYLLQQVIRQEPEVAAFNPSSLNTCRIMTFRRPWNGETTVIAGMLRLGCGKGIADNLALGGVSVDVDGEGKLADYGVDHDFGKFTEHPGSKKKFQGFKIPHYREMCEVACKIAAKVPGYNLLSFDMVVREDGKPCVIEINATSMTLAQLQTVKPLFGDETDQVIDWCANHRKFDKFNHIRTWY